MDANKLSLLREINYEIRGNCGMCKFGTFTNSMWGTCSAKQYIHLKHTDNNRQLSINKFGRCQDNFQLDEKKITGLGHFREFVI